MTPVFNNRKGDRAIQPCRGFRSEGGMGKGLEHRDPALQRWPGCFCAGVFTVKSLLFVLKFKKLPRFCFWCSISPWEQDKWVDILSKPFQMINFKNTRLIDNIPQFQVDRARRIVRERCPAGSKMIDSGQWSFSATGSLDWGGGRLVEKGWVLDSCCSIGDWCRM